MTGRNVRKRATPVPCANVRCTHGHGGSRVKVAKHSNTGDPARYCAACVFVLRSVAVGADPDWRSYTQPSVAVLKAWGAVRARWGVL